MNRLQWMVGTASIVLLAFSLVLFASCKKKDIQYNDTTLIRPCENVVCLNGGVCDDGLCQCPLGYEGVKCETLWSTRYEGSFTASDECYTGPGAFYDVTISPHATIAQRIQFNTLGTQCAGVAVDAEINPEKTSFLIPMQKSCGEIYLSGYGNISTNGKFINVYLKQRDSLNHSSVDCSIVLNRK